MGEGVKDTGGAVCSAHVLADLRSVRTQGPEARPRGLFVTGTDTGVGKTILSAALVAALSAAGKPVRAHKPVVTGLDESGEWPPDHELLALAAGIEPDEVAPLRYGPAVSPHLAAELAGERIEPDRIVAAAEAALRTAQVSEGTLIVEGVGGLLVPLAEHFTVCDLAARLGLPLLIAAQPGLGTINHTLLTLQAARGAGLSVAAVVLTPWPAQPSKMERSNRETIARLGQVEVEGLPCVAGPTLVELARAGAELPWQRWLGCCFAPYQ
jgi:dethiobiotin synthetase